MAAIENREELFQRERKGVRGEGSIGRKPMPGTQGKGWGFAMGKEEGPEGKKKNLLSWGTTDKRTNRPRERGDLGVYQIGLK